MTRDDQEIRTAPYGSALYEGLRELWCEVFGDGPEFVDMLYGCFGDDIIGRVITDDAGRVCSALTCYLCGSFDGRPVYVSYAVCTREDKRGLGLSKLLNEHTRDAVTGSGGISIVSPANEGLEAFYERFGYEPLFFANEREARADGCGYKASDFDIELGDEKLSAGSFEPLTPELSLRRISGEAYNEYREEFLADRPHIALSGRMLRLIEADASEQSGLFEINRGDAVCAVSETDPENAYIAELLLDPRLAEISPETEEVLAGMIAARFGSKKAVFRTPGGGYCQSMAAGIRDTGGSEAYFGFPVE